MLNYANRIIVTAGILLICFMSNGLTSAETAATMPKSGNALSCVPSEAWGAVVINDLGVTSQSLDAYCTKLGIESVRLQQKIAKALGVGSHVDLTKPIVIVVMNNQLYGNQPYALILTVHEYDAFITEMKGKATETAGVMKGENDEMGEVYIGKKGSQLVMGPTDAIVKAILESKGNLGTGLEQGAKEMLTSSNFFVRVNFQSLGQIIKSYLLVFSTLAGGMGGMGGLGGEDDNASSEAAQLQMQTMQQVASVVNALSALIDEMNSVDIGIQLKPQAAQLSLAVDFKKGQEMAELIAAQKETSESLLVGLSADSFVLAGGQSWIQKGMSKFQEAMLQMTPPFADPADTKKYKEVMKSIVDLQSGGEMSFKVDVVAPREGQPAFIAEQVTKTKDSKKYIETFRKSLELQSKIKLPAAGGKELSMDIHYKPAVMKVGDITVDEFSMDIGKWMNSSSMPMDQVKQIKPILDMVFGSSDWKVKCHIAAVDKERVILSVGGDQTRIEGFIKNVKSKSTGLGNSAKIIQAEKMLPKKRFMEAYLDLGRIISVGMGIAMQSMPGMMENPVAETNNAEGKTADSKKPTTKPAIIPTVDIPLVGMTGTVQGSGIRCDIVVPLEAAVQIMKLKEMVSPMGMGMPPGMGGMNMKPEISSQPKEKVQE